ncbi:unnamed protein product, partial [marine sediment metagenome]
MEIPGSIVKEILLHFSSLVNFNNYLSGDNDILSISGTIKSGVHPLKLISELPEIIIHCNGGEEKSYFLEFDTFISSISENPKIIISVVPNKRWTIPQISPTSIPLSIRNKILYIENERLVQALINTAEKTIALISSLSSNGKEASIIDYFADEENTIKLTFSLLDISSVMIRAVLNTIGNFYHNSTLCIGNHDANTDLQRYVVITLKIPENQLDLEKKTRSEKKQQTQERIKKKKKL